MELETLQENLNHGLTLVSRVLSSRPQMAILSNILLKAENGQLEITASNLETTITTSIGAKVEVSGEFTVPGRTFSEIISGLSAEKLTLKTDEGSLVVSSGKFKAKIAGTPAAEFPKLTWLNEGDNFVWSLDRKVFKAAIDRTIFAAAIDESRAVLTGVLFQFNKNFLSFAATDGFRLSVNKISLKNETKDNKFILPAKALIEADRILGEEKGKEESSFKLTLMEQSNQVVFDLGDVKIYSRLISGNFPDFEKIIPSGSTFKLTVTTEELSKAVRLAAVFARDSANIVKLKIQGKKLKISANAPQVGENESEVDVRIEKGEEEEFAIAFNYRYLLDLLASVGNTELIIELTGALSSGMFRLQSDPNFLHIIMPVRVQGN